MADLTSALLPSTSRQTIPISSVTLACRMFVTTGNLWPSFQISGSRISFGGYISHKRLCSGLSFVVMVLLGVRAMMQKGYMGYSVTMLHVTKACLSSLKYKPCDLGTMQPCNYVTSSTRYRWNDANLIPIAQRCLLVLEETDIFLIDINIYKPAHLAVVIYQSLLNPRIAGLQFNDGFTDGG